jgi:hypothetical protein
MLEKVQVRFSIFEVFWQFLPMITPQMHQNMHPNAGTGKTAATWCQAGSMGRETESWLVKNMAKV